MSIDTSAQPHGTRARYVGQRCRCDECKASNVRYYHERMQRRRELEASVTPSGPPVAGTLERAGRVIRVLRCPGAGGAVCVVPGGAWLKGGAVCVACIERATVWNGLVPAAKARRHLRRLSKLGVGYKSVAEAGDVGKTVLCGVLDGSVKQIRRETERRILAVDRGALAGGSIVDATEANELIAKIRARGFTLRETAALLGYQNNGMLQLGKRATMKLETRMRVERLWRRIDRGEMRPAQNLVPAAETYVLLRRMVDAGVTARWLGERFGFYVNLSQQPKRVYREKAEAVAAFYGEIERRHRDGEGLPDGWQHAAGGVASAFGFDGGWSHERRTSKKAKQREEKELRRLAKTPRRSH